MANSEIIDTINLSNDRVGFGSVVTLENLDNGGEVTYQIVGPDESDIPSGKISIASPLGKALVGKEVDEEVIVQTPGVLRNIRRFLKHRLSHFHCRSIESLTLRSSHHMDGSRFERGNHLFSFLQR